MRLNVVSRLQYVTEVQHGYFTRAQARTEGVADFELDRAVGYDQVVRLDHGVYRIVGAGVDRHAELRVAWLRLDPTSDPRERTRRPTLWVSHRSAANVLSLGDYLAPAPEFISIRRLQPRFDAKISVRRHGLRRDEWVVRDGFAVTAATRTLADLARSGSDGGHLGRFAHDAIKAGEATAAELQDAVGERLDLVALLEMAEK